MSARSVSTVSPAECAEAYERLGRSVAATAHALAISHGTVRRRLAQHFGVGNVPVARLRSSGPALGAAFERRVRDDLVAVGWWVVRAAGSKGVADLVALRRRVDFGRPRPILVSVKRGGAVPVEEWNALLWLADEISAAAIVALRPKAGGVEYMRITGLKDGRRGRRQPWELWAPDLRERVPP